MSEDTTQPPVEANDDQTLKLGDGFDEALIGATIVGQYVYSLNKLQALAMKQMSIDAEQAQQFVAHQAMYLMQTHGPNSPVFVDDWQVATTPQIVTTAPKEEAPKIVLTDAPAPKEDNVILIPGVTHGAVRGFLAPDQLHS